MGWGRTDRVVHTEGVVTGRMEAQLANQRDSWARGPTVRSKWMSMGGRGFRLDADACWARIELELQGNRDGRELDFDDDEEEEKRGTSRETRSGCPCGLQPEVCIPL